MTKKCRVGKKKSLGVIACATMLAVGLTSLATPIQYIGAAAAEAAGLTKYYADFDSLDDAITAAEQLTEETAGEGDTLLKNQNKALPLRGDEWVSVLGVSADSLIGAAPTGGQSTASAGGDTVAGVLEDAGFKVNPTLKNYYAGVGATIGTEEYEFNGSIKSSFSMYNDVAVVVLARTCGEGSDASRKTNEKAGTNLLGESDTDTHVALASDESGTYKHYLMLTDSERELLKLAKENFEKVVVVLNTSNAMEIKELRDDEGIDAVINIDRPGEGGLAALAKILKGEINPSGGLVDEWYGDFTADPTWYNFGNNNQTSATGAGSNTYMSEAGNTDGTTADGTDVISDTEGFHGVDYEEGIYLGYKYYETYYYDMYQAGYEEEAQQWWEDNVAYAFGYGLSYTTFSFQSEGVYTDEKLSSELPAEGLEDLFRSTYQDPADVDTLYLPVTVTNTGNVAGKKTVQVYVSAPYDSKTSVVEKASVSLVGFAKTDILEPGESQTVVVSVNVQDMASWYSYYAQSDSETYGAYIMEAGDYTLRIMQDSHYDCSTELGEDGKYYVTDSEGKQVEECYAEVTFNLNSTVALEQDDFSGLQVSSLFTDGVNDNGDGIDKDSEVTESYYGNYRTAAMMADETSSMTTITRSTNITKENPAAVVNNGGASGIAVSVVNYTGVSDPTKPATVNGTVNGFDLSFPKAPAASDLTFQDNVLDNWSYSDNYAVSSTYSGASDATSNYSKYYENDDDKGYVWSHTSVPETWEQAKGTLGQYTNAGANGDKGAQTIWFYASSANDNAIKFADMAGVNYDDPLWDEFLNQFTYDELCQVNTYCGYGTVNIDSVGKEVTEDRDGPNSINQEFQACAESLQAAAWNTELAEKRGIIIGNIALITGFQGWYAPGADIHRSPFSGRNNEYFSQDGILGGYIGAALTQGVQSKGIICYAKHTLMNDQETNRGCLFTWCDEQAMRENYMKNFQMIFQEGGSKAGMTAYGRIAGKSNTNNTNLSVELYQNEWGSHAYFVTDGYIGWNQRTNPDMMVRAGAQTILTTANTEYLSGQTNPTTGEQPTGGFYKAGEKLPDGTTAAEEGVYIVQSDENGGTVYELSYTQWYCVREMAHSVLYQVANSAGQFNGYSGVELKGGKLEATESLSVSDLTVSIEKEIGADAIVTYSLEGELPEGLSFDAATGEISGTPAETGTFNLTVNYLIDGWITKSATYELTVGAAIQITAESSDFNAAAVGEEFYAELVSDVYTSAEYNSLVYSLKEGSVLPEGLTLNEDGTLVGTPSKAGTYTFTVVLTADNVEAETANALSTAVAFADEGFPGGDWGGGFPGGDWGGGFPGGDWGPGGGGSQQTSKTVETTFTIVVTGEAEEVPGGGDETITVDDLNDKIEDLESSIKEMQNTLDSLLSSDAESGGCGSAVTGSAAAVGAIVLAGAVVGMACVATSKKKKD